MSDERRLEILYDHYKSVVEHNRNNVRYRYRYLFYILVVMMLVLLQTLFPKDTQSFISEFLKHSFGVSSSTNFQIVETGLLLALMLLIVRYLQLAVNVERSYPYTRYLEALFNCLGVEAINYEGKRYDEKYPTILNWLDVLYKVGIPLIFTLIALLKIVTQFPIDFVMFDPISVFDIIFAGVIILFVGLYWLFLYKFNKQERDKTQQTNDTPAP